MLSLDWFDSAKNGKASVPSKKESIKKPHQSLAAVRDGNKKVIIDFGYIRLRSDP